jgi:hypothetical protein
MPVIHNKVKAGGTAAAVITVLVAIGAVVGVDINVNTQSALLIIGAAISPVIAGFAKRA